MSEKNQPVIHFVRGDLFQYEGGSSEIVMAHCISQCAKMGAGIAKTFSKKYPEMRFHIQSVKPQIGDVIPYFSEMKNDDNNKKEERSSKSKRVKETIILNMITKKTYKDKPTKDDFKKTLLTLRNHCESLGYNKIGIPKIGCGLDKLDWDDFVLPLIIETFSDYYDGIEIFVYHF